MLLSVPIADKTCNDKQAAVRTEREVWDWERLLPLWSHISCVLMSYVIWLFTYQGSSENQKKGVEFLKPVFTNNPFIQAKKYKIALKKPDSEQFEILKKKKSRV